jgi:hypothetical protein
MLIDSGRFGLAVVLLLGGAALGAATSARPPASARPATSTRSATATNTVSTARPAVSQPGVPGDLDILTTVGNVTVNLPAGWALNVGRQIMIEAHPANPDKDATGTFQASIAINRVTLSGGAPGAVPKADVGLGANQQAADAKKETAYQSVEKPAAVVINGLSGVKYGGTFKRGAAELRSRAYILARNDEVYLITFASLNSKWPAYQKLMEESVATFTLKK